MNATALIVAAGSGTRTGLPFNKLLCRKNGKTIVEETLDVFDFQKVLVVSERDEPTLRRLLSNRSDVRLVLGGKTRSESVRLGLRAVRTEYVLIHDGARPFLSARDLGRCIDALESYGSCVMTHACTESVRLDGRVVDRSRILLMSTPQAFRTDEIRAAYEIAPNNCTDDASVYEACYNKTPHLETLLDDNRKITTREDLRGLNPPRVGAGYDEHRLAEGRAMILCGVRLPVPYGPVGHSDADVPVHALMDALLSAVGEKDIGTHFPDTDPAYEDADSTALLCRVLDLLNGKGYLPSNVSIVLHAQRPKLAPYIDAMKARLSELLGIPSDSIGITATSGEGMGEIGRGEGIACYAVATVRSLFC